MDKTRSNSDSNNELWAWVFGSLLDEQFESLTKTKDGGCIFIGTSFFQDLWFVKLFSDGEVSLLKLFKGPGADFGNYGTDLNPIIQTQDEGFAFVFSHLPTRTDPVIASGIDIGFVKASPEMDYVSAQYVLGKKGICENRADYEKLKDLGYAVAEAGDGDFFVLGLNYFQDSSGDLVVFKISTSENRILWKKLLRIDGADDPAGVVATEDGGCYVFGNTSSFNDPHGDAWVVKFSSTGECLWQRAFGGAGSDRVYSALLTSEEGLILAGATSSFGNVDSDFWLFAISPAGDIKPGRQIAIGGNQNETAYSLDKAMNGDILLGGSTDSSGNGNQDCLVIRVSPVLKVMWAKTFGGKDNDYAKSVQEAADGNLYVAGPTRSFGYTGWWYEFEHKEDVFVLKLSSNGETNVPDLSHEMNVMVTNTYASSYDTWACLMESDLDFLDASGSFSDFEASPFPVNVSTLFSPRKR